jgi:hypothetical protein
MKTTNINVRHSFITGIIVSSVFPILIFSKTLFIDLLTAITDFGIFWNPIFWGIIFPLFIIFQFWNAAKKANISSSETSYFKTCSQFSFRVSSKLIISFFIIYITGLFLNGISVVLRSQIPDQILYSILIILFLSFILMILTFLSSLLLVRARQNPPTLN